MSGFGTHIKVREPFAITVYSRVREFSYRILLGRGPLFANSRTFANSSHSVQHCYRQFDYVKLFQWQLVSTFYCFGVYKELPWQAKTLPNEVTLTISSHCEEAAVQVAGCSESFFERVLSYANNLLHTGNTLLSLSQ